MTTPIDWPVTVEDLEGLWRLVQELRFRAAGASQVELRDALGAIERVFYLFATSPTPLSKRLGEETVEGFSKGLAKAGEESGT